MLYTLRDVYSMGPWFPLPCCSFQTFQNDDKHKYSLSGQEKPPWSSAKALIHPLFCLSGSSHNHILVKKKCSKESFNFRDTFSISSFHILTICCWSSSLLIAVDVSELSVGLIFVRTGYGGGGACAAAGGPWDIVGLEQTGEAAVGSVEEQEAEELCFQ